MRVGKPAVNGLQVKLLSNALPAYLREALMSEGGFSRMSFLAKTRWWGLACIGRAGIRRTWRMRRRGNYDHTIGEVFRRRLDIGCCTRARAGPASIWQRSGRRARLRRQS